MNQKGKLNVNTVLTMSFGEMLEAVYELCKEEVPDDLSALPMNPAVYVDVGARAANNATFLFYLWAAVSQETARAGIAGIKHENSLLNKKKEALYELAKSLNNKREAASRAITVICERNYEGVDIAKRHEQVVKQKEAPKTPSAWDSV